MPNLPGFNLELETTEDGPFLAETDPECRGLCRIINGAARGEVSDLVERLEAGERIVLGGACVEPPLATLDLTQKRQEFASQMGEEPEDVGAFVLVDGEPYPIMTLEDIFWALNDTRAQWHREQRRTQQIEAHWRRVREIQPYDTARLFRPDPIDDNPSDLARHLLGELEERATLVDALDAELTAELARATEATDALKELAGTVSAKRRFLLLDLHVNGLLSDTRADAKRAWLDRWQLRECRRYLDAAGELERYMRSDARANRTDGRAAYPLLYSPISIDWFRKPQPIPDKVVVGLLDWTAWCEAEAERPFEDVTGGAGQWYWHSGSVSHTFYWRLDNGETPALVRVT